LRLASTLEFGEDIFSLAFCSEVKDSTIAKYFNVMSGKLKEEEEKENEMPEAPSILSINSTDEIVETDPW
jgi:hypothetical protein